MILPQAMVLSRYRPPSSQHSQDRLGIRRKRLKRRQKKRGAYGDDVVVMKGAQLMMSASLVAPEAENQKREDDPRVNKSGELEST
jgi:hypothetical protein